ncbi:hypothetical protein [Heyndrickxia coagulans]|jgi:hypothetical protein|uniref:hypothetical protein n=1 Tax=Heyndrickxia coagulans TaxID=1398 RepID=UPI000374726F|nr:hypothetical protein [Heyndrickxia coagulans]MDT9756978.1 hypothetical protein [Heyndrickxia coagulans]
MMTKRHLYFNLAIIVIPWASLLFLGRRNVKRYALASACIGLFEITNHLFGHMRKWWKFYDKKVSFLRDELPFSVGPYMPLSMWILKYSYGNFKKFVLMNIIADGLFAFLFIDVLKKLRIVSLNRLSHIQFFIYLHYKAYLLYGMQGLYEKLRKRGGVPV